MCCTGYTVYGIQGIQLQYNNTIELSIFLYMLCSLSAGMVHMAIWLSINFLALQDCEFGLGQNEFPMGPWKAGSSGGTTRPSGR